MPKTNLYYSNMHNDNLQHHGIKGQHWGVRRYQFADGSYTPEGKIRYASSGKHIQNNSISNTINTIFNKPLLDETLKSGTSFSRIQTDKSFNRARPFYATYKKDDIDKYQGLFGHNLKSRAKQAGIDPNAVEVYKLDISAQKKIKIPSEKNVIYITNQLLKEPKFKENLKASIADSKTKMKRPGQQALLNDALDAIDKNDLKETNKKKIYEALNLTLTHHNPQQIQLQNRFYSELKKKGYSAIVDVNDKKYSSYHAKSPVIIFDTSKVKLQAVSTLDNNDINKVYASHATKRIVRDGLEQTITILPNIANMTLHQARNYSNTKMNKYLGASRTERIGDKT